MNGKFLPIIIGLTFIFILNISSASASSMEQNYTDDTDFESGILTGLEHNNTPNQLQLSENASSSPYPYIWVPNTNQGTVSKIDIQTGLEVGRYRLSPPVQSSIASPSRTAVDLQGNCWVGNRGIGTLVKIGLLENGVYFDLNGNGRIETCFDKDGNGLITDDEILPWGEDECVLWEIILIPGYEGSYRPGTYNGTYSNNPIPRALAVDSENRIWVGTYGTMRYYQINSADGSVMEIFDLSTFNHNPYGALIDQYGVLWSSSSGGNNLLRLDTINYHIVRINFPHITYGLAIDRDNHLFVSGYSDKKISRMNILTGTIEWTISTGGFLSGYMYKGMVVTDDGDLWAADTQEGFAGAPNNGRLVSRYSNDGVLKAQIYVGSQPSGLAIDNLGKIWVVDNVDEYIHRINPQDNSVELSKRLVGSTHYAYSDMTGSISNTITSARGTWNLIHDTGLENTIWGKVSWNSLEPSGTQITVRVRSSGNKVQWSEWETAYNNLYLQKTPQGRYLEIESILERKKGNQSPVLYDLTVHALTADIQITNALDNHTPHLGDTVQIVTLVTNQGPDPATNLRVYPVIPAGFSISPPDRGTIVNGIWNVGTLNPGESVVLEITGLITTNLAGQNLEYNVTEVHNEYDPTPGSPSSIQLYSPLCNLEAGIIYRNGQPVLVVKNNGPDSAYELAVQVNIPSRSTPHPSQGFYKNGLWYLGYLASGEICEFSLIFPPQNKAPKNQANSYRTRNTPRTADGKNYYQQRGSIHPPERSVPMEGTGMPLNFSTIAILLIFFASYLNKGKNGLKPNKWMVLLIILSMVWLLMGGVGAADGKNYTSSADFSNGMPEDVKTYDNQIELLDESNSAQNFIWVPNTNQGTVSKVDVKTGREVARYRTSPHTDASPFRTAVDSQGNCWVSNLKTGTLVKIGLYENENYQDLNHNDIIETCRDLDGNGAIMPNEILPWGQDECVLGEVVLISGQEGIYIPGQYPGIYPNYGSGIRTLILDSLNNIWAGNCENGCYYYIDGSLNTIMRKINVSTLGHVFSSGLMDLNGIIWSAGNNLLRLDPSTGSMVVIDVGYNIQSITADANNHLFLYGYLKWYWSVYARMSCFNTITQSLEWTKGQPERNEISMLVADDGTLYLASYYQHWLWGSWGQVTHYNADGDTIKDIITGNLPIGLSIDKYGKIWVLDASGEYIYRINPQMNGVDLYKMVLFGSHVALGGMTAPQSNAFSRGTWTIVQDSQKDNSLWGNIQWTGYQPPGTKITVQARSSLDQFQWSNWEEVDNGDKLKTTPAGRYLQVKVILERFSSPLSPILYDIAINPLQSDQSTDLAVTMAGNQTTLNMGETIKLTITATNNGPMPVAVNVNYQVPLGLKLLSTNGLGFYNSLNGNWDVGRLPVGNTATLELVLQASYPGYFVNTAIISILSAAYRTKNTKKLNCEFPQAAAGDLPDLNPSNNQASVGISSQNPNYEPHQGQMNILPESQNFPTQPTEPEPSPSNDDPPVRKPFSNDQLNRDWAAIRDIVPTGSFNNTILPEWKVSIDPPEIDKWEMLSIAIDFAGELLFLGTIATTPGSGEYLQQVQTGMIKAIDSLKLAARYFTKDPLRAFRTLRGGFTNMGKNFVSEDFMKGVSSKTFRFDPNVAQTVLQEGLCKIFPKQAPQIRTLFNLISGINFIKDPFEIIKSWGAVVYSLFTEGIPDGNYEETANKFWNALEKTFNTPLPFTPSIPDIIKLFPSIKG